VKDPKFGQGPLGRLTRASLHHPFWFLTLAAGLFAGGARLGSTLFGNIHSSFQELLPAKFASVRQINDLLARVGGDGNVLVVIESKDGRAGLPAAQAFAPVLVKDYLALGGEVVRSIEWNRRDVEAWYADHWPMFASVEQLTEARDKLEQEVKKAKRKANPLNLHLEEEEPAAPGEERRSPWLDPKKPLPREEIHKHFENFPGGFLVPDDRASVTLIVRPTGTALGVGQARALVDRMRALAERHQAELDRNHLRVGFGGSFPMFVAEYESLIKDVISTALLCLALVLASLLLFFRDIRSTLSLGIAVLTAVAVTFGITRLTIGYLNSQTAFLGAIVLGNGINYGLIYLARVRQLRRAGIPLEPAVLEGAQAAWRATLLASIATSVSFGVLTLADNRGFRHFGIIGGMGMVLCWVFTFALVPALLALFERIRPVKPSGNSALVHPPVPSWVTNLFSRPAPLMAAFSVLLLAAGVLFVRSLPTVIERNLSNLTNELRGNDQLLKDNERAQNSLGRSIAGAVALLQSQEEADAFCDVVRARMKQPRYAPVLGGCETVSSVVPGDQERKLALIGEIARRLSDAVIDAQPEAQRPRLRQVKAELLAQKPLSLAQAPGTLLDGFREKDGTVGRLAAVTARPDALLELAPRLNAFVESVRNVPVDGRRVDATGENVIFSDLLQDIDQEGPRTTLLSFLFVCLLVLVFFRQVRMSVETLTQLLAGVVLMGGVATVAGLKINFFNFIVFPITFGIAVDYGANVILRASERRGAVLAALVEVGPAVALCSWTTIIGYGSLVLSANRALRGFGWYALIGEVCCVLTALVLLPAMLLWAAARRRPEESVAGQPVSGS
jgi:predicted exporter